jgi:hypothetical protein
MGVASAAKILSIRAVTDQGDPGYRRYQHESASRVQGHLADAIHYATSQRVGVISMSLGYQGASLQVRKAISAALARGIVVVASSGNSGGATAGGQHGNAPYSFPADYPGVLGVGAVAQGGVPAGFSSDNLSVQVAAPGVRVPAQGRDGQYWLVSGTSPACALTAGVAALIKSVYPTLAPALVVQAITASTTNKPHGGYDEEVGFGTVDATAALKIAGRLARVQGTGRGKVATAQFGGGPAATPPVPVAPRGKRQFVVDSLIALACLAVVLIVALRLIVTRRPAGALAGAHGGAGGRGWAAGGTPGGWAGAGPRGAGPPNPGPSGPGAGAPGLGVPGTGVPGTGVPGTGASAAGGVWPDGGRAGYGRSAGYRAPVGYEPTAGYPAPPGYGPPEDFQQPADPRPPAGYRATEGYQRPPGSTGYEAPDGFRPPPDSGPLPGSGLPGSVWPAGSGEPPEHGAPDGFRTSARAVPPGGYGGPTSSGEPAGYGELAAYRRWPGSQPEAGPPTGYGPDPGNGLSAGYAPSSGNGRSGGFAPPGIPGTPAGSGFPGSFEDAAGASAGAGTGPVAGYPEPPEPQDAGSLAAAPPAAADDDTWPSSGSW